MSEEKNITTCAFDWINYLFVIEVLSIVVYAIALIIAELNRAAAIEKYGSKAEPNGTLIFGYLFGAVIGIMIFWGLRQIVTAFLTELVFIHNNTKYMAMTQQQNMNSSNISK